MAQTGHRKRRPAFWRDAVLLILAGLTGKPLQARIPAAAPDVFLRCALEFAFAAELCDDLVDDLGVVLIAVDIRAAHRQIDEVVRQVEADERRRTWRTYHGC